MPDDRDCDEAFPIPDEDVTFPDTERAADLDDWGWRAMADHCEYTESVSELDVIKRIIPAWRAGTSGCSKCHGEEARNG